MPDPMSDSFFKTQQERDEDRAIPFFSIEPVEIGMEDGRPKYEDREFVTIRHPGDRSYSHKQQVDNAVKDRFRRAYEAWKANEAEPEEGTPISMWPVLTPAQVLNFKASGIRTIEDLATMPDSQIHHLGHAAGSYRQQALAWIESARKNGAAVQAAAEAERLKAELALRDATIADLAARIDAMEKKRAKAKEEA